MKTIKIVSALFLSSALLTTACTPRDVKVVNDQARAKILEKKNRGKGGGKFNSTEFKIGMYSAAGFLMEKQVEAIEFVRLALGKTDPVKTQYTVAAMNESGTNLKIKSNRNVLSYSTDTSSYMVKTNPYLDVTLVGTAGSIQSVEIKGNAKSTTDDAKQLQKVFINYTEDTYSLLMEKGDQDGTMNITVKSAGNFYGSKGGKKVPSNVTVDLVIVVDTESLINSDDVKILSLSAKTTYDGSGGDRKFTTAIDGKDMTLKASGLCNVLNGSATIAKSGGRDGKPNLVVSFDEKNIKVGDKWTHEVAQCGSRPTVDIARLLIY